MKAYGWRNRSAQVTKGGPWSPDLTLVRYEGETRTDIQIVVPKTVPLCADADDAKREAYKVALWAATNLLVWDVSKGLVEVSR